ncbi:TPA: type-F conjugative transfer system pilin assembly protein TraF [Photobacterium damselae]
MKATWGLIALLAFSPITDANNQAAGWRWYKEPKAHPKRLKPQPKPQAHVSVSQTPSTPPPLSATEQMTWFHGYMEEVKTQAMINPTVDNVLAFMRISHFIEGKTTDFAMAWKQALLEDPTLSYTAKHPTQSLAKQTQNAELRQQREQAVKTLTDQGYGLFLVYRGQDPISIRLAPSIQAFADLYAIPLLGVTLDDTPLSSIKSNRANQGKLAVKVDPALLLVNPNTGQIKPLAYGFISQDELLGRFLNVATQYAPDF